MPLPPWPQRGLHVIAKPIGPICNLRCAYCFYLGKESLYPAGESWRMSDETLDAYVRQYLDAQPPSVDEVDFAFQGGEPTLMGLDFFRRVVELQAVHARPGVRIHNSLQTNGVLLDDAWCEFLAEHRFLVGLSLDGPAEMHDKFRVDRAGEGTFERVTAAMRRLLRHGVEFNTLTCIHQHNANHPLRVYRFLRDHGVRFMQFIPVVERETDDQGKVWINNRSVLPVEFGRFLIEVFDEWFRRDVGRVFVRDFDAALGAWTDRGRSPCVYAEECGRALALEHNGDLYACDHFVDPEHRLGNIHETPIRELADAADQRQFGRDKSARLPDDCRRCPYRFACQGGCPKDRTMTTLGGQPGLSFLCEGFRMFFGLVAGAMEAMAAEVRAGRPAANVAKRADAVGDAPGDDAGQPVRRNAPCPCGSGKKFKNCCMRRGA
ncbi:MAG: anaerobic sulfatase maturase [Planctomycetia bacterium]|nr:anaerobic sulfatase maturase [Planctomycetia bacterium]